MSQKRDESYSARYRLGKSSDFKKVFSRGKRTATDHFVIFTYPNHLPFSRLGIQVKAKLGTAAKRNYIKRIVREVFRRMKDEFSRTFDMVLIAKAEMAQMKFRELDSEFRGLLKKYLP